MSDAAEREGQEERQDRQALLLQWLGAADSRKWTLQPDRSVTIGRDADCDILLDHRLVSRNHAKIFWRDGAYFIRDLASKNGTHVNGQPLMHEKRLQDGDEVQVALRFKLAFASEDATTDLAWETAVRGIELSPESRVVTIRGRLVDPPLSSMQFRLLHLLWQAGGGVVTRDEIKRSVWPEDMPSGISRQSIDALMRRLRETLALSDPHTEYIVTVRGHGYRLQRS